MLVLSRKTGERIRIGNEIVISVVAVQGKRVQISVEAPLSIPIRRSELVDCSRTCSPHMAAAKFPAAAGTRPRRRLRERIPGPWSGALLLRLSRKMHQPQRRAAPLIPGPSPARGEGRPLFGDRLTNTWRWAIALKSAFGRVEWWPLVPLAHRLKTTCATRRVKTITLCLNFRGLALLQPTATPSSAGARFKLGARKGYTRPPDTRRD